jgi:type IV pilus assembly protein PilO
MADAKNFSLSKLPLAGKIGVGVVAVVLLGVAYFFVLHNEVSARIEQAKRHTAELDSELAKQRQAQASYFADRDELAMRQQRQRELNKILPADTEAAAFLSSLQQVSNISGIDLKAWQPQEEQAKEFYAKVPMRLEITGKFHQLVKFVYEVGKLDRIINMENIELFNPKMEGDDVVLSARCLATTFHLLKKASPPPAPGAPPGQPGGK